MSEDKAALAFHLLCEFSCWSSSSSNLLPRNGWWLWIQHQHLRGATSGRLEAETETAALSGLPSLPNPSLQASLHLTGERGDEGQQTGGSQLW